jgi:folate-binding protein YgfZ
MAFLTELPHRTVIQLSGPDKVPFLQGLVTNDVTKIDKDNPIYTALLTPQGKFLFDLFVFQFDDSWWIDCERVRANELIKRLTLYKLRSQIELFDLSATYRVFASWEENISYIKGGVSINDPRLPQLGQRIYASTILESKLSPLDEYDVHRLSLGVPDGSRDIPIDKGIILECGFDEMHAIDWNKGCYMGQELTARTRYRGLVRKRLLPVLIEGNVPEPYTPIFLNEKEVGEMRTSAKKHGLALLRLENIKDSLPTLKCGNTNLTPYIPSWMRLPELERT